MARSGMDADRRGRDAPGEGVDVAPVFGARSLRTYQPEATMKPMASNPVPGPRERITMHGGE